jgi:translation elongation factor EF-1alpha
MGKEKVHISLVVIGHVDAGESMEGSGEGMGS